MYFTSAFKINDALEFASSASAPGPIPLVNTREISFNLSYIDTFELVKFTKPKDCNSVDISANFTILAQNSFGIPAGAVLVTTP